jgi:hypothetical protein
MSPPLAVHIIATKDAVDVPTYGEVWSLNGRYKDHPQPGDRWWRWDKWFDLHARRHFTEDKPDADHLAWLEAHGAYVRPDSGILGQLFPTFEMLAEYGPVFTNSLAWLLGYAHMLGAEHVSLLTGDIRRLGLEDDFSSVWWWLGKLEAEGVSIHAPYWYMGVYG